MFMCIYLLTVVHSVLQMFVLQVYCSMNYTAIDCDDVYIFSKFSILKSIIWFPVKCLLVIAGLITDSFLLVLLQAYLNYCRLFILQTCQVQNSNNIHPSKIVGISHLLDTISGGGIQFYYLIQYFKKLNFIVIY